MADSKQSKLCKAERIQRWLTIDVD